MRCSTSSRTGCPTGTSHPRKSTTGGSSTSINLPPLRVEDPVVFDEMHKFILELLARGAPTGLRIDHVDGLFSPGDYLRRLQARAAESFGAAADASGRVVYLVVEKILGPDEQLPADWPVHGTTGYEFASVVNNLFVDGRHERAMDDIYQSVPSRTAFAAVVRRSRVPEPQTGRPRDDVGRHQLARPPAESVIGAEPALPRLHALQPDRGHQGTDCLLPRLPDLHHRRGRPQRHTTAGYITRAVRCSQPARVRPDLAGLRLHPARPAQADAGRQFQEEREERARFIGKFQQITSPVAAKGIEDTAFYVYNRLVSLNEVGGNPTRFGLTADRRARLDVRTAAAVALRRCRPRRRTTPSAARTCARASTSCRNCPRRGRTPSPGGARSTAAIRADIDGVDAPDANDEYLLYQTLVGAWPFTVGRPGRASPSASSNYMVKAMREAKRHTSWINPDEPYEAAVLRFVDDILDRAPRRSCRRSCRFRPASPSSASTTASPSCSSRSPRPASPTSTRARSCGTSRWSIRTIAGRSTTPVRQRVLQDTRDVPPALLLEQRADGRLKMSVMIRALHERATLRRHLRARRSTCRSAVEGDRRDHLFAFARRHRGSTAITCVPRLVAGLLGDRPTPPIGADVWGDTRIMLPSRTTAPQPPAFRDAITGARVEPRADRRAMWLDASAVFGQLPVALLVPVD